MSRRTKGGDGRQGSKVPGGLVGRENLAMPLVPQTAAATWKVLRASVCLLFPVGSLCLHSVYIRSGVSSVLFK